ncbi:hypothetical protein BAUCODRAFT_20558 [Baudoinia panamericana UAMH 10762]|uniref:SAM-dependent MTase RsmB/NOP-type domain-containing protein n=1 Tax=Baudoinia panamericana (strain UAMH 10762) TaxID=717646 RepID=M2N8I9_BAUPA|nr:uncharacterized protein BAUCODRAFT_20558 [Baudoinia panamericana UAMH 10762]EMD00459.1 hypothetical protein BAUCODRAFT_20558 [Baudoinia panamericana UAMH 10762]
MARGRFRGRGGGGGGGRGRGRGRGGGGGGGGRQYVDNRQSFEDVNKHNEKMERFYNTIDIVPSGADRDAFWAALRTELPNSFRFTGSKGHALSVRRNLVERFFPVISQIKHEGKPVALPQVMPWYPEGLAYSMTTPKNVIRKYEPFKEFQKFLVSETGVGNISRQEAVSMIPPLLLDVRPEHTVLDLCAAPGSKSAQLVEAVHAGEEERVEKAIKRAKGGESVEGDGLGLFEEEQGRSTGLLIANDVNYQRAQMLVHQVKRLNSPNLIVMNHDATMFPSIELPSTSTSGQQKKGRYLKFDRILADVPCSGDGTCRKNPSIWKEWSPQNGLGLYITQVRILTRALQMLKVGGRVVYSTCSMNPVEDEAVVASAIERCGGVAKVKLLDCSNELPELVRSRGLTDWSIMSRTGQIYESWAEAEQYEPDGSKVAPGMFAPEEAENIPLQHCMRVYPHQQNTGGFFIAALEKLSEIRAKPEADSKCMNKQWAFSIPSADGEGATNTAFGELMADVRSEPVDEHGHLHKANGEPVHGDGNVSAAQRQNSPDTNGVKRKAEDVEDEIDTKKVKLGDEPDDSTATADTSRRERWPLPPSVAMAVKAEGGEPGSDVVKPEVSSDDAHIQREVQDAAANAPFDSSLPRQAHPLPAKPPLTEQQSKLQQQQQQIKQEQPSQPTHNPRKRGGDNQAALEAFKYLTPDHPELQGIYAFYQLHPSFPRTRFLVRNPAGDPVKGIYYSSALVKDILTLNSEGKGMKFVHAGVKMFMKQDAQGQEGVCRWRIQTEGLPIIEGWVGDDRVVRLRRKKTLRKLLVEMFPRVGRVKGEGGAGKEGWEELGEIGTQVRDMGMGCCVLRVEASGEEDGFKEGEEMALPVWRSLNSVNLMLPKEERKAMLLRIFDEDPELINHSEQGKQGGQRNLSGEQPSAKRQEGVKREDQASAVKEEDAERKPVKNEGGQTAGSSSAEGLTKEFEARLEQADDSMPADDFTSGVGTAEAVTEAELDGSARALEASALAERDRMEAERLEEMEDENTKIVNAMPERDDRTRTMFTMPNATLLSVYELFIALQSLASTDLVSLSLARCLILSDTHGEDVDIPASERFDVVVHCGDLTEESKLAEFRVALNTLRAINAPLKLVIPGNHDFTLDTPKFKQKLADAGLAADDERVKRAYGVEGEAKAFFETDEAQAAGINLLNEGSSRFILANGGELTVFSSPYTQSLHADWGFQYRVGEEHEWDIEPGTDIVMTHGPPRGVLDYTDSRQRAGAADLFAAIARARPRVHCFGHIHEGWGAKKVTWRDGVAEEKVSHFTAIDNDGSGVVENLAGIRPRSFDTVEEGKEKEGKLEGYRRRGYCVATAPGMNGRETLFVNAAIEGSEGYPRQLPWLVEMDLPVR